MPAPSAPLQVQLVDSPGFHMLLLPFRDDTRAPEAEQAMLKRLDGAPPRANDEQVCACVRARGRDTHVWFCLYMFIGLMVMFVCTAGFEVLSSRCLL
jgi:hypothetical protein